MDFTDEFRQQIASPGLLGRLTDPMLMSPDKLQVIAAAMLPRMLTGSSEGLDTSLASQRNSVEAAITRGIGVINVYGSLVSRGGLGNSGFTSYSAVRSRVEALRADGVDRFLFKVDSPGGEVPNCFEVGKVISDLKDQGCKTAVYVEGGMNSGAYGLLAGAEHIVAAPTASTGSIGVFCLMLNQVAYLKEKKIDWRVFKAGAHKAEGNPYEELSEESSEFFMERVNYLYDIFTTHVSECRSSLNAQALKGLEARRFGSKAALEHGLIDSIGTVEDAIAYLSTRNPQEISMGIETENTTVEAPTTAATVKEVDVQALISEAVAAERTRCVAISDAGAEFGISAGQVKLALSKGYAADMVISMYADLKGSMEESLDINPGAPDSAATISPSEQAAEQAPTADISVLEAAADLRYGVAK